MLIQCTFCHAQATLSEEQEGAKVRCASCNKVYVARAAKRAGKAAENRTPIYVLIATVALLLAMVLYRLTKKEEVPAETQAATSKSNAGAASLLKTQTPWDAPQVRAVRDLYEAAANRNLEMFGRLLAAAELHDAGRPSDAEALRGWKSYLQLSAAEKSARTDELARALASGGGEESLEAWKPFDGYVSESGKDRSTVRVEVAPRGSEASSSSRTYEWTLVRDGQQWRPLSATRILSEAEIRAAASKSAAGSGAAKTAATLRGEPHAVDWLAETSAGERARLDGLYKDLVDLSDNGRGLKANLELARAGKSAIPRLLTGLSEIHITDQDTAVQVNLIDQTLRQITGHATGFSVTDPLGPNRPKNAAAIRGWFLWWERNGADFKTRTAEEDEAAFWAEDDKPARR